MKIALIIGLFKKLLKQAMVREGTRMKWIEGDLPTEWGRYLVTVEYEPEYDAPNDIEICFFTNQTTWLWDESRQPIGGAKILAWMRLPDIFNNVNTLIK